ncbi:MAG: 3-phosphoglycerate dehydrogenase, partial [Clostridia bacterium]|nr:3-phosphoglycerate dehydrogenase [Clostridia bacterium]
MYNVLKLNKISPVIDVVFDDKYSLTDGCENPDGIIVRSYNMAEYEVKEKLLAVARAGAGVNNIPIDKMSARGVVVFNTPGANANAVKELVLCGMLIASRDIIGGNRWVNNLTKDVAKATEKGKSQFGGTEISGKTLGVIGLGAIGVLVANAAVALGMKAVGYDPYLTDENRKRLCPDVEVLSL